MTKRIVYLDEAADTLGLSKDALRKRIKRGSIKATKDVAGRWQVIIEDDVQDGGSGHVQAEKDVIYKLLQEQIEQLKQQNDDLRKDVEFFKVLTMQKEQKILQLEDGRRFIKWWPFGKKNSNEKNT